MSFAGKRHRFMSARLYVDHACLYQVYKAVGATMID